MNGSHTFGYYVALVGFAVTVVNVFTSWPIWVSFIGLGISLLGLALGYAQIALWRSRNRH